MSSPAVLDLFEPGIARVFVFDLQEHWGSRFDSSGRRYAIAKHMMSSDGKFRITHANRRCKDAAISYAKRWFNGRKAKAKGGAEQP